ncbi:LysR family transcriptional regulator [Dichotomicrobium thermohalophilum]|uniref:LysR family transcriptional regulator n=1 Tax=Dichotomicrobium thermohalophilum TaxID=933063 RepID=A0A397Q4P2_9HYPH|nr:LysR family transcriptional regulator [Dichotomicrobium thermohalophilum]RIA56008.1 LysR family transcriptional regulator [Dichotomicrobium thermohalophilum]
MDLRQMRYFAAVAEELSYSRASERLNISQSALSRQIQLFEEELGVRLFDRLGRTIALTAAGEELLQRCQTVLSDADAITRRAGELSGGSAGRLRIGATPQTLESVLAPFLPGFQEDFPDVEITLVEDGSARLSEQIERSRLDLAIAGRVAGSPLAGRELFPLGVLAVLPSDSPHLGRSWLDVTALSGENLLLMRRHFMTRQLFDSACEAAGIQPAAMMQSASPHCLLAFVAAGLGTAIIPSTVLLAQLHANVVRLYRGDRQLGCAMSVVWDPRRYMAPVAAAFIEALQAATRADFPGKEFVAGEVPSTISLPARYGA